MNLLDILDRFLCTVDFKAKNKIEVLEKISEIASKSERMKGIPKNIIFDKLSEREAQGTTGFGKGLAIPHTRIKGMDEFLLFIITSNKGVNFEAIDNKKVNIFFVLLGPEVEVRTHLKILAGISRLMSNASIKNELLKAPSILALYEAFVRHTEIQEQKEEVKKKKRLMYIILYMEEFLYEILEFLIEKGVEGATIIDSFGMGQYISNIPLFASFIGFMKENKNQSKTIILIIDADREGEIITGIENITGNLDKKQGAMIFTLDLTSYKGTMKML